MITHSPLKETLTFDRVFSDPDVPPLKQVRWEKRSVSITDETGGLVFKQENIDVPVFWSDLALKVVASKYFYGENGTSERENSVGDLVDRVASTIADWGLADGYFASAEERDVFRDELTFLCLNQYAVFNSPVWFNVGLYHKRHIGKAGSRGNWFYNRESGSAQRAETQYEYPQCSACFIQRVEDNMESIMSLATNEAMLFKFGSGTGSSLSTLRSKREKMSGGGKPSGPLSFLRVYDQVANVVKSGGKTRRAAKMNTLHDWHGDIEEFIKCKLIEEKKAHTLIDGGYDGSFNGDAYGTVAFQNENLSVRVSDEFMTAALGDGTWHTRAVTTGKILEQKDARKLFHSIAEGTWFCGDPGIQFDSAIQKWHTCKTTDHIYSTNPCSEYIFLDNTACNLASINLMKFRTSDKSKPFDVDRFKAAVRIMITAQDILVDNSSYPTPDIAVNSHIFRTLGLGYANLGSLIMSLGHPYDSSEGRALTSSITALMTGEAYCQSARIATRMGAFKGYDNASCAHISVEGSNAEPMGRVIKMHQAAIQEIKNTRQSQYISDVALESWSKAIEIAGESGYRNAQVTVLAPTGTIAFMMDCDTTGIEPDIALVKYKLLAGGGMLKIVNRTVPLALESLGYSKDDAQKIIDHIEKHDTIENIGNHVSGLSSHHLPIFDCAFKPEKGIRSIHYRAHLRMMAAAQPFISGAISKTVNLPNSCTIEDIKVAYTEAWKLGLKCVAMYRDGSKRSQPLNTSKSDLTDHAGVMANEIKLLKAKLEEKQAEVIDLWERLENESGRPVRRRLPDTRRATTHKFSVGGHEGYLTVGHFEDGAPGELFVTMSKEGSTVGGLMDCIGTLTSMCLQYGVPLETLVRKFSFVRFEPSGFTNCELVKNATSVIDYVFRWMESEFVKKPQVPIKDSQNGHITKSEQLAVTLPQFTVSEPKTLSDTMAHFQKDAPSCSNCGAITVRNGSCYKCNNCGESMGCS